MAVIPGFMKASSFHIHPLQLEIREFTYATLSQTAAALETHAADYQSR
jgi:hypothetical protein